MDSNHRVDIYCSSILSVASAGISAVIKYNLLSVTLMCVSIIAASYSIVAAHYTTKERKLSIKKMENELFEDDKKDQKAA